MSLNDPSLKMSKSNPNLNSRILLSDSSKEMTAKLKSAKTDSIKGVSFDPEGRPAVSNLLSIASHLDGERRSPGDLAKLYADLSMAQFKEHIMQLVDTSLAGIRHQFRELVRDENNEQLDHLAEQGAHRARQRAKETMMRVRSAVGLQ